MAKMKIIFDGFTDLADEIEKAGKNLKPAVDEALTETQRIIQRATTQAASVYAQKGGGRKGYATGKIYRAILQNPSPEWSGTVASVEVGFDLKKPGGNHSIFVMYGTKSHPVRNQYGTPRKAGARNTQTTKDTMLFDAIFGTKIRKDVAEAQEEIMRKYLTIGG